MALPNGLEAGVCSVCVLLAHEYAHYMCLYLDFSFTGEYGCYIFDMDETVAKYHCTEVYKVV